METEIFEETHDEIVALMSGPETAEEILAGMPEISRFFENMSPA